MIQFDMPRSCVTKAESGSQATPRFINANYAEVLIILRVSYAEQARGREVGEGSRGVRYTKDLLGVDTIRNTGKTSNINTSRH